MLTPRQNFIETVTGGKPDRYVNQYEYMSIVMMPIGGDAYGKPPPGRCPEERMGRHAHVPGGHPRPPSPCSTMSTRSSRTSLSGKSTSTPPRPTCPTPPWDFTRGMMAGVDRDQQLLTVMIAPGIFETVHYLMGMEDAMIALYEEPEAMHELIDYITDFEMRTAEQIVKHVHPTPSSTTMTGAPISLASCLRRCSTSFSWSRIKRSTAITRPMA